MSDDRLPRAIATVSGDRVSLPRSSASVRSMFEIGRFFDHLPQIGVRGFVAERAMDDDYTFSADARRKP